MCVCDVSVIRVKYANVLLLLYCIKINFGHTG